MGGCCATQADRDPRCNKPSVRMCSSGNHFPNFADIGDTVVLFVDFGNNFKPVPRQHLEHSLGGTTAGRVWPDRRHLEPDQYEVSRKLSVISTKFYITSVHCAVPENIHTSPTGSGNRTASSVIITPPLWKFQFGFHTFS